MQVKKGQSCELHISNMATGGRGIAKIDGFAVFVDGAVTLDRGVVKIIKKKKNHAEAVLSEIIDPSPFRKNPVCKYSTFCGGCKWQFITYEKQLDIKKQYVIDAVERIGFIKDAVVHATIPSDPIYEYRNKMEFSCSNRRWFLPKEMDTADTNSQIAIGLHVPGTFFKILDIQDCKLYPHAGNDILDDIRSFIKDSYAPVYDLRSHIGFWRFVMLRYSFAYNTWMVNLITSKEDGQEIKKLADLLTNKYPDIGSVVNNIHSGKSGTAIGEYEIRIAGDSFITEKIGPFDFEISSNSFFQTNTYGAERLYAMIKHYACLSPQDTVLDLYSGTGSIAIFLANSAGKIAGIEVVPSACADAQNNCRINHISNCSFILEDVNKGLRRIGQKPDVIIMDPPRIGMHKDVVKQVLAMSPERLVYVSCNPATMARDLGLMQEQYKVLEIQPVDMFPHTHHVECVAKIEKK
jgi:23S rRNA (uracil1939-C5)-methyltransferase